MNLKQDQRAMLQLLLERGQTYADLSGLLDLDVAEVRARARQALTVLGDADPDTHVALTDYLLGQADPIGRADAARHLSRDPEAMALATELSAKLTLIAPNAQLPDLSAAAGPARARREKRAPARAARSTPSGEGDAPEASAPRPGAGKQTRMVAAGGAIGLIVITAVLALAGVFGSDGSADTGEGSVAGVDSALGRTDVVLRPVKGSGSGGEAIFDQTGDDFPFMDLRVNGLPKLPKTEGYFVWFMFVQGDQEFGLPVKELDSIDPDGNFQDRLALFSDLIPIAVLSTHIDVSRSNRDDLQQTIEAVVESNPELPVIPYRGQSIARGKIPRLDENAAAQLGITPGELLPDGNGQGSGQAGG